jgi:RNA polymerase sigma-70 factor (ECF subfamily)
MEQFSDDKNLIKKFLKGDESALRFIVEKYMKPIYNFIYQYVSDVHEAEDITQEVFIRVWRKIKTYDTSKSFKTWVFAIAKNATFDYLKKKKTLTFSSLKNENDDNDPVERLMDESPFPDELMRRTDLKRILNKAMDKLPAQYRATLFLYYQDGFNFREISETLNEPIDTVKSRHRRALVMLKKELAHEQLS